MVYFKNCNKFFYLRIIMNMDKQKDNGKFKIICIKAPKWLSFFLKRFIKSE